MKIKRLLRLNASGFGHHVVIPALVIILVAVVGVRILRASHAESALITTSSIASPTNLTLNDASTTEVALRWAPIKLNDVTYDILRNGIVVASTDSYTTNYLDSGLTQGTSYTYTVTAQKGNNISYPSNSVNAVTGKSTSALTSCGKTLSQNGNYILTSDIAVNVSGTYCLEANNVSNVSLDCQGHNITTTTNSNINIIQLGNVSHFLITNCHLSETKGQTGVPPNYQNLLLAGVSYGTIENNSFGTNYSVYKNDSDSYLNSNINGKTVTNSYIVVRKNNFVNSAFNQSASSFDYIGQNNFTHNDPNNYGHEGSGYAVAINSIDGNDNVIYRNTIDGGSGTDGSWVGGDDGILLGGYNANGIDNSQVNDLVAYNNISNVWDAGIETTGSFTNSIISHNSISNAFLAGIGTYYYIDWQNNTIGYNTLSNTQGTGVGGDGIGGVVVGIYPYYEPSGTTITLQNNKIIGNKFIPYGQVKSYGMYIDLSPKDYPQIASNKLVLSNNVIGNNNLSHLANMSPPVLHPQSMVVDGGGNVCATSSSSSQPVGIVCH